jgi:peptide/nickel transport system permease protein
LISFLPVSRALVPPRSRLSVGVTRFFRRIGWEHVPALLAAAVIVALLAIALTVPWWAPYDPIAIVGRRLQEPSWQHWLGTDALGRDVMVRTLYGTRYSLPIVAAVLLAAVVIGVFVGAVAGFLGGVTDNVLMRVSDVTLAFPPVLLAMAIAASLGSGLVNTALALIIVWWPIYARLMLWNKFSCFRSNWLAIPSHFLVVSGSVSASRGRLQLSQA